MVRFFNNCCCPKYISTQTVVIYKGRITLFLRLVNANHHSHLSLSPVIDQLAASIFENFRVTKIVRKYSGGSLTEHLTTSQNNMIIMLLLLLVLKQLLPLPVPTPMLLLLLQLLLSPRNIYVAIFINTFK